MKICCLSDTHNNFPDLSLYSGDIIIHCGDISIRGLELEIEIFLKEFAKTKFKHKIMIPGNHDFMFENDWKNAKKLCDKHEIICLNDSGININGINIWGSPITPTYQNWAFNRNSNDIVNHWKLIPNDTNILITHGPPKGVGSLSEIEKVYFRKNTLGEERKAKTKEDVGCDQLKKVVDKIKPKFHLFGHIHSGYGIYKNQHTTFINCSMNNHYIDSNLPVEFLYVK
jgi:Icc-related predicted phosphoesterase